MNNLKEEVLRAKQLGGIQIVAGYKVFTSTSMVVDGPPTQVKRTWKERLFSLPWKPFKSEKTVVQKVPSDQAYLMHGVLVMHPEMLKQLKSELHRG